MRSTLNIDQTDCIESAAYLFSPTSENRGFVGYSADCSAPCKAPCRSCGGGCYGCKGSKSSKGADISTSDLSEISGLAAVVKGVLD